ncbi:MAG: hypothetical protein QOE89_1336 [Pseudonocardiales bacterium]|jgi:hypothetical protein|nr:hypothetical protein [Pseudonocardiales bacterium]
MTRLPLFTGLILGFAVSAALSASAAVAAPPLSDGIDIVLDQKRLDIVVGDKFGVRSEITNRGTVPADRFVAHLNIASLEKDVYVDPEDWSTSRSAVVAPLNAGGSTSLTWDLQSVNAGSFDVYVVLLPVGPSSAGSGPVVVSSTPLHVTVAGRRTLTAGGSLPVVLAVPAVLGFGLAATRWRIRRAA